MARIGFILPLHGFWELTRCEGGWSTRALSARGPAGSGGSRPATGGGPCAPRSCGRGCAPGRGAARRGWSSRSGGLCGSRGAGRGGCRRGGGRCRVQGPTGWPRTQARAGRLADCTKALRQGSVSIPLLGSTLCRSSRRLWASCVVATVSHQDSVGGPRGHRSHHRERPDFGTLHCRSAADRRIRVRERYA